MTYPVVEYVKAAAGTTDFDVPFPFLSPAHVEVLVNDAQVNILEWIGDRRLRLSAPVQPTDVVIIQRVTPIETALVKFHDGAILTQEDLNTAVAQLLYKQQELQALYDGTLKRARVRLGEANGIITNPEDVVAELANLVLEDEVLANFRQRIADIDLSAQQLANQAFELTNATDKIAQQSTDTTAIKNTLQGIAGDLTALQVVVDALSNLEDGTGIATLFQNERDARVMGDTALAATVALIGAKSGSSNAFLLDLNNVRVSPTESLAQRLTTIKAATDGNAAAIQAEQNTRSNADSAEASARETLGATLRNETAAAIETERKARVDADGAEATKRDTLAATLRSETSAAIQAEQQARATAISAEATSRNNLAATLRGETDQKVTAAVSAETTARVNAISAEATQRTTLASTLRGEIASSIQSEATTRANQDGVFTGLFTLLGAKNAQGTAFVLNDSSVQLTNGQSLATRLSGIDTTIGNVSATVTNNDTARVNGDKANADAIQLVTTTVGNHTASIGTLSQSIDGIKARYGVSLDVNGFVTGFVQNNDGKTGSFVVLANRFAIVDPNQGSPFVPFEVSNGTVYIKNAVIGDLSINTPKLADGSVSLMGAVSQSGYITGGGTRDGGYWEDFDGDGYPETYIPGTSFGTTVLSYSFALKAPATVFVNVVSKHTYYSGVRAWEAGIFINGTRYSTPAGSAGFTDCPGTAASVRLGAGTYVVEFRWWGVDGTLRLSESNMYVQGIYK